MNPIEKLLDENTPAEEKEQIKSTLTPEQMTEYATKAKAIFEDNLAKAAASRKEKARIETLIEEKNKEVSKVNETMSQFRSEQILKARQRLVEDFGITDEAKVKSIEETFSKLDSGKVDSELIYQDMMKAFAAVDAPAFVESQKKVQEMKAKAAAATAASAAGTSAPPLDNEPPKFTPEVTEIAKTSGISEEAAKRIAEQGYKRTLE